MSAVDEEELLDYEDGDNPAQPAEVAAAPATEVAATQTDVSTTVDATTQSQLTGGDCYYLGDKEQTEIAVGLIRTGKKRDAELDASHLKYDTLKKDFKFLKEVNRKLERDLEAARTLLLHQAELHKAELRTSAQETQYAAAVSALKAVERTHNRDHADVIALTYAAHVGNGGQQPPPPPPSVHSRLGHYPDQPPPPRGPPPSIGSWSPSPWRS